MDYLLYGGLGVFGFLILLVKGRGFIGDLMTKKILSDTLKDTKAATEAAKAVDNKVNTVNIDTAKVDQKIEDLKTQQVTSTDISDFLKSMEKKSNDKD